MSISGIVGCGDGPLGPLCSLIKTDWNCALKAFLMIASY